MKQKLSVESVKNPAPEAAQATQVPVEPKIEPKETKQEQERTTSTAANLVQPQPPTPINPPLKAISFKENTQQYTAKPQTLTSTGIAAAADEAQNQQPKPE